MARLGLFGSYDREAPRLALLKAGVEALGHTLTECHEPPLPKAERAALARAPWLAAGRLGLSQARLWQRRHELAGVDALLVPYPGHAVMPLARVVSRGLGVPLLFDPFVSLYDTVVGDRELVLPDSVRARALALADRRALALADLVLADTSAMAAYYQALAGLPAARLAVVPVGADERRFAPAPLPPEPPMRVLFVGHMLPLHGVPTIVEAARQLAGEREIAFELVGTGPEDVQALLLAAPEARVTYQPAVEPADLPALVASAHVCLGCFGTSEKAARVVPHKVYEAAAAGRAVVTRESPAVREAFGECITMVPAGDAAALATALRALAYAPGLRDANAHAAREVLLANFGVTASGRALVAALAAAGAGSFQSDAGMS